MTGAAQVVITPVEAETWRSRVAHAFSRAASRYTILAGAQLSMGEALWRHLPPRAAAILDLGCGPGHWSARLASRYGQNTRVTGLDLAPGMLAKARDDHGECIRWLLADAGALPLDDATQDLVFSNLAIQWCPDLDIVLSEIQRVLRPGGRALINTLGPGTLGEVAHAWSSSALLGFRSREHHLIGAQLAGFDGVRLEEKVERFFYPDLAAVMASIKGVGAQTARPDARLTRADLARAQRRYESLREPRGLPVSYTRLTLILDRK
ncbi:methyltransferase domain-containing protein [Halomonas alkalisoli]|uniref:methyltransferase domain-containing protein n=1 Tax=Halomonas alkalisoli TaxID=2907158 RepID=UPI001F2A817F|nr:methyltransferase domain-containing protein [Halomonas alkalisoli]MCE9683224.1 methyltransferase domain-containing protein [Halomonas alkalisoli]